jgi:IS30 family transposase
MIRRPFPKGTDFGNVTDAEVARAESWMNNYPRKILGWKTSEMLFREYVAALI